MCIVNLPPVLSQADASSLDMGHKTMAILGAVFFQYEKLKLIQDLLKTSYLWQCPVLMLLSIVNEHYAFALPRVRHVLAFLHVRFQRVFGRRAKPAAQAS